MLKEVLQKLLEQGCQALDEYGQCKFRGENGTKCAVGLFIKDEEYDPDMEDMSLSEMQRKFPDMELWSLLPKNIWGDCQYVHDDADKDNFESDIEEGFKTLLRKYPDHA